MPARCFASPIIFDGVGVICTKCSDFEQCGEQVKSKMVGMKARMGEAKKRTKQPPKYKPLDADDKALVERVTTRYTKAGALIKAILKNRIDLDKMRVGTNPFNGIDSHGYAFTAAAILVVHGWFVKGALTERYIKDYKWSIKSAQSHELVVLHTFEELGAITINHAGIVRIAP